MHLDSRTVALFTSLLCTSAALAWQGSGNWTFEPSRHLDVEHPHVMSFGKSAALSYDPSRVAVQIHGEPGVVIERAGFNPSQLEPMGLGGWHLLTLPPEDRTRPGLFEAVGKLSQSGGVRIASPVFIDSLGGPLVPTETILMQFEQDPGLPTVNEILIELGAEPVHEQAWSILPGSYKVTSRSRNGFDVLAQANALAARPDVRFSEPDMIFTGQGEGVPDDPGFGNCWGLHNTGQFKGGVPDMDMDSLESWDIEPGDPNILVLVIDTGSQQDHPDINQAPGMDFTGEAGGGGPVNECDNHGTPVAGCVSAIRNNTLGTVGAAPGVTSISARCFVSNIPCTGGWSANYSWTADAIDWGFGLGARVSNNSNYYGGTSDAIEASYEASRNGGMVHFGSAGNDAVPSLSYPSSLETVNAVAALYIDGELASFSNWGDGLAFSAPGVGVYSTDRTGADGYTGEDYVYVNGTSFASPYAAGVAAQIISVESTLTAFEVETVLQESSVDLGDSGYDIFFGWGFVNANNALLSLFETGACCVGGDCSIEMQLDCVDAGGDFLGEGTDCSSNPCNATSDCLGDISGDDHVGVDDLLAIIAAWGSSDLDTDLNEDGIVGVDDLLIVIGNWGPCPEGCVDGFNCGDDGDLFTCGSDGCFCMELSDGNFACLSVVESTCDAYEPCPDGSCPPGFECVVNSCCPDPVCVPVCN